ncbi:MAG: DMT family transporter [Burkholderiaceae bacterium]|nr:DMT family transporter [Burkholderiaceae bacterium]
MNPAPSLVLRAYIPLACSMALVGVYVALAKPLLAVLPVFALAFLRFLIAAVALAPFTPRARAEPPLSRQERWLFFALSFFGNFLFTLCLLAGLQRTSATAAGVILATLPAAVALLSRLLLRERLPMRARLAIALAVAGIALLQWARTGEAADTRATLLGNLLVFGAVLCEATYVIVGKRLTATRRPLRISALLNLGGLLLAAPLGLWQLAAVDLRTLAPVHWALLVFYALAASWFAVWLWMTGLKHLPANQAGVFTVALPITASMIGVLFLGEAFTAVHALALAAAAAGVLLMAGARTPVH